MFYVSYIHTIKLLTRKLNYPFLNSFEPCNQTNVLIKLYGFIVSSCMLLYAERILQCGIMGGYREATDVIILYDAVFEVLIKLSKMLFDFRQCREGKNKLWQRLFDRRKCCVSTTRNLHEFPLDILIIPHGKVKVSVILLVFLAFNENIFI